MSHSADAALHLFGIADPAQRRRDHVAMFQSRRELRALVRIMPQPVQQFGESPLRGVNAAAPLDGVQLFLACQLRDLSRFLLGAMIAPEIVVIQRNQTLADRNHA